MQTAFHVTVVEIVNLKKSTSVVVHEKSIKKLSVHLIEGAFDCQVVFRNWKISGIKI